MNGHKSSLAVILVLTACLGLAISAGAVERKYLISLKNGQSMAGIEANVKAAGGEVIATIPQVGMLGAKSSAPNFMQRMMASPKLEAVVPDPRLNWLGGLERFERKFTAADGGGPVVYPDLSFLQWGMTAIDAPGAWMRNAKGKGAVVAVLDTGFCLDHPDLIGQFLPEPVSRSFVPWEPLTFNNTPGSFSHGTHTAGIVAANDNEQGVVGVAPEAQLLLLKVLTDDGWGDFLWLVQAIVYATDQRADVISMSLSGLVPRRGFLDNMGTPEDPSDDVWYGAELIAKLYNMVNRAAQYAYQHGTTMIAAASNDAIDRNHDADLLVMPADCMNVLQISATGPVDWRPDNTDVFLDFPAFYSNYGSSRINFAAPGGHLDLERLLADDPNKPPYLYWLNLVLSSVNNDPANPGLWAWAAGTSMATPHAAGVAALIVGQKGHISPAALAAALRASADDLGKPGKDDYYGLGRVNAANAVR
jgi:lantibiotic leader peptide-processing serine protease